MSIEKGRISSFQATLLVSNTILATTILFLPAILAKEAGQDAWLAILLGGFLGFLLGVLVVFLSLCFPEKNLVEYAIELLGPWGGRILGIFFGSFIFYINALIVREFGELLTTSVMPETPLVVFIIMLIVLAAYGVYLGLEVFARVNEIIFPLFFLGSLLIFALAVPDMDFSRLKPFFECPFVNILRGSGVLLAFFAEGVVLAMIFPYLRRPKEAWRVCFQASFLLLAVSLLTFIGVTALFGVEETSRMVFPVFDFAKVVRLGFIERIESLSVGIWVTTVSLKVMVYLYVGVLAFAQSFNLRDYRPLVLPGGLLLAGLSILIFTDNDQIRVYLEHFWGPLGITVQAGGILLLFALALIRKKSGGEVRKGRRNDEENA